MSSWPARYEASAERRKPKPSWRISSTPSGDFLTAFSVFFLQGENHVLLARTGHVFQALLVSEFQQFGNRLLLEFGQIHRNDVIMKEGNKLFSLGGRAAEKAT